MTEALLIAHGSTVELLVDLIRARRATAQTGRIVMGPRTIEVARVKITEAGRRMLGGK